MTSCAVVRAVCGDHQILCRSTEACSGEPIDLGVTLARALADASLSPSSRPYLACVEHLLGTPRLYEPIPSLDEGRIGADHLYEYHLDFRSRDNHGFFDNALPRVKVGSSFYPDTPLLDGDYVRFRWWVNQFVSKTPLPSVPKTRLECARAYAELRAREARNQLDEPPVSIERSYWVISSAGWLIPSASAGAGGLIALSFRTACGALVPVIDAVDRGTAAAFTAVLERCVADGA